MSFRQVADEIGLTAVGIAVAGYLIKTWRDYRAIHKPSDRKPFDTPALKQMMAEGEDDFVRMDRQVKALIQGRGHG